MADTIILGIAPTFYLKKIEPLEIPLKYEEGKYSHIDLNYIKKIKAVDRLRAEAKNVEVIGANPLERKFTLTDRNNNTHTCITTNNIDYNDDGSVKERMCYWCRVPFNHSWVGLPYRLEIDIYDVHTYYTDGCYCSFNCVMAEINEKSRNRINELFGIKVSSLVLLECLHSRIYTEESLYPSLPFWHHEFNGGALNDKEFYGNKHIYIPTTSTILVPTKRVAIQH